MRVLAVDDDPLCLKVLESLLVRCQYHVHGSLNYLEQNMKNDEGKSSEDCSQSSDEEEEVKKKVEKPAQVYGKQVELLKSIIKSCGIGIPPSVYKRAKQAPESKWEAHLMKELKEILEKEGLSTNPSEKESIHFIGL